MKTRINKREPVSHTIQHKKKAANQAPLSKILQAYKERSALTSTTVQREAMEEDEELLQGKFETAQREASEEEDEEPFQRQKTENKTGLPDDLKAGVEAMSGYSMDDVRVHYNSDKPAQLQALAYTQGTDIHVGPGQEKHLPHEAWHVVQQKQGRVKPTVQMQGVQVNDEEGLEKEADRIDNMMFQRKIKDITVIQCVTEEEIKERAYYIWLRKGSPNQKKEEQDQDYFEAKEQLELKDERMHRRLQLNEGMMGLPALFGLDQWIPKGGTVSREKFESLRNNGKINADDLMKVIPQGLINRFDIEPRTQRGFKFEWDNWHVHGHEPDTGASQGHIGGINWIVRIKSGRDWLLSRTKNSTYPQAHKNYQAPQDWSHSKSDETISLSHIILLL